MKHIPKIIAIILAVILISLVYVLFFSSATVSTTWKDTETSETIGEFGQTLIAKYMDGSIRKMFVDNNLLSVLYNNKEVESIQYVLKGRTDLNSVTVDISSYTPKFLVFDSLGTNVNEFSLGSPLLNITEITLNSSEFQELATWQFYPIYVIPYTFPDATYTLTLTSTGTIYYDMGNGWVETSLPEILSFEMDLIDDRVLNLVFGS